MPSVLLDAGALVAILNRNDHFHETVTELLAGYDGRILSTWPVIGEACALVHESRQILVLDWVEDQGIETVSIDGGLAFMRRAMVQYADLPCDFADASLLYAAQKTGIRTIWSIDRDFNVYRMPDRTRFHVVPERG